jgi:diguanylate cyclase (GGDEF)-like protein/PAS domain S-box-containing protein
VRAFSQTAGPVVDERLAPAGLTRLLGSYGARRAPVLGAAAALFFGACLILMLVPMPPVTAALVFVVPVGIIASELGTRAGLLSAGLSIATVLSWQASGLGVEGTPAAGPRSLALLFLAWIIGRTSDRAARSRRLLEQVLEATTDSIYVKDLEGRYVVVNSATADLIGRTGSEILGRRNDVLLPDVAEAIATHDAAVLERHAPSDYEVSGRFGDRSRVLSITQSPFCDASGTPVGSLGIARDITEQRRLQERFRRAFEDAPIGMGVADPDGRYLDVNQALCAITARSRAELCGQTAASLIHPDDLEAEHAATQALHSGEVSSFVAERRYLRPDGSEVWVARSVTLVRDAGGMPMHLLDQVQDITDRRRFERELRQLADHDPLTGLFNRRRFEQELARHVAEVGRYGPRGALLVLDLDQLKQVNDTVGHHAGDELIVGVATLLRERLRASDIVARLGGDEFAVLLPNAGAREAELIATDLIRAVRESASTNAHGGDRRVTTSVGVALFGIDGLTGEQILVAADLAMYEAKAGGGDGLALACAGRGRPSGSRRESAR